MQRKLIDIAATLLSRKSAGCIQETEGGQHEHRTFHDLLDPSPEAFLINLNYSVRNATAMDSLALLLSIPENFYAKKGLY